MIYLGERFGKWPWEVEEQPTDKLLRCIRIMGIESEAKAAMEGLEPDEEFFRED